MPLPRPHLFLVLECERPAIGGARWDLTDVDEVIVARASERSFERRSLSGTRQLVIGLPDKWLSSLHARLLGGAEGWTLQDAGSTNGSAINGNPVTRAPLNDGDVIELGHTVFVFRAAAPTPRNTARDVDLASTEDAAVFRTTSPTLEREYQTVQRLAASDVPVILLGETGTGKELLARALHAQSGREGSFVAVNCGALPENLVETQLFGHVRGAFTGAVRDELGLARSADRGTLLFDEIDELAPAAQITLLRFLQEKQVLPVGSARPISVDVRIIAATHAPLHELAEQGDFRTDLLARLDGFSYALRPLRERREDLGTCIASILRKSGQTATVTRISVAAARALIGYDWPRNIRELEQCLARCASLAEEGELRSRDLPPAIVAPRSSFTAAPKQKWSAKDAAQRLELIALLQTHRGNVSEVARALGKARMQVHRWLRKFGLDPDAYRG
ncbi:MAG TPA: sigma 54-interacting transcriptional regulator [Polyangiaceae bacterium]|nr:sigma 54-interacting transcriptional regulator [Polyangiaceae bacterium]